MEPNEILSAISAGQEAPHLIIEPSIAGTDGSFWLHDGKGGYVKAVDAWTVEQHIGPVKRTERFGDVESWATYVTSYGKAATSLLSWGDYGLTAIIDYPSTDGTLGRCQWKAEHPFERSTQWQAWARLTSGQARSQRETLEALEDLGEDIVEPDAATLVGILRSLRASVNKKAETDLRADGTTFVSFSSNSTVDAGKVTLPPEITIAIPVLKGHVEVTDGKTSPVVYRLTVRLRVSVDDDAHLKFRLSMPTAERVLESVFADRVAAAKALLGEGFTLLRAAS